MKEEKVATATTTSDKANRIRKKYSDFLGKFNQLLDELDDLMRVTREQFGEDAPQTKATCEFVEQTLKEMGKGMDKILNKEK